jgi:hypothetical protein
VKFPALTDPVDIGPVELAYATMAQAAGGHGAVPPAARPARPGILPRAGSTGPRRGSGCTW